MGSIHYAAVQSVRPFGVFVKLDGYRKFGLVHVSQVCGWWVGWGGAGWVGGCVGGWGWGVFVKQEAPQVWPGAGPRGFVCMGGW